VLYRFDNAIAAALMPTCLLLFLAVLASLSSMNDDGTMTTAFKSVEEWIWATKEGGWFHHDGGGPVAPL